MRTLQDMMSDRSLTGMLVGIRMQLAARRHTAHFFRALSKDGPDPDLIKGAVAEVLPPRSSLLRPGRELRAGLSPDQANRRAYLNAALNGLKTGGAAAPWAVRLRQLLDEVRRRAACPEGFRLHVPEIRAIAKQAGKRGQRDGAKYRVVTAYTDLADRLLLGAASRYLLEAFDSLFTDSSHAFRGSRAYSRSAAVKRLHDYVTANQGRPVFVAECDIRNFFDTVDHDVARGAFHAAVRRVGEAGGWIDPVTIRIMEMYLDSYDFFTVGKPGAEADLRRHTPTGMLPGAEESELRALRPDGSMGRVGIPQGGALSPLLANLVLDAADRAVLGDGRDRELLYVRYCDDMIIMHPDKEECGAALLRYMTKVRELMFLVHPPVEIATYDRTFFGRKSKMPYRLADPAGRAGASPWASFLGYQIRYDGAMRVRPDSLQKHRDKQSAVMARVMNLVRRKGARLRRGNSEIMDSVAFRLVAASVGRKEGSLAKGSMRCWMDAFPHLSRNRYSEWQMRRLDRFRDRMLDGLVSVLRALHPKNSGHPSGKGKHKSTARCVRPYLGRGLSYCGKLIGDRLGKGRRPNWRESGYGVDY